MVVNIKHSKDFDVYIGRPGPWGNPFVVGEHGTRAEVIELHKRWLWKRIQTEPGFAETLIREIRGKRLGCFCAPKPCHGDTLVAAAEWCYRNLTALKG